MADERTLRVARNESRFRDINEALRRDLDHLPHRPELVPFVCECGTSTCSDIIEVTFAEYEQVRASSRRFLVFPDHNLPEYEDVVEEHDPYFVVQKHADTAALVDATDPRVFAPPPD